MLVHFLTIYSPLPSNWRHSDKLTHISGPRPFRFLLNWQHLLTARAPGPWGRGSCALLRSSSMTGLNQERRAICGNLSLVNGHGSKRQLRDTELWPTQRKGQLFPKWRSQNHGGKGIGQVDDGHTCGSLSHCAAMVPF